MRKKFSTADITRLQSRDRQNGPGPGTKFLFLPGPGLICFSAGPGMFFFITYWTVYFLISYAFFLLRIYKSPIFIYDPDRSRLLTSVLIAKLRIIDNYLEGWVVWV